MGKNNNTEKKFKLKRIPVPIYILSVMILTFILTITIYLVITISNAKLSPLLKDSFETENIPTVVEANQKDTDGTYGSSVSGLTYSYSDKVDNLKVGLVCTKYKEAVDEDTSGSINFYIGFQTLTTSASIKVSSCKVIVAERWSGYTSSATSVSSSYYTSTYLDKETMSFAPSRSITVSEVFPQRFILGMNKVETPNIYVYVTYTDKNEEKSAIIEFEFEDYFISGQSIKE